MNAAVTEGFSERVVEQIDFSHPWVEKYRVPVVTDMHVGVFVIAALVVPDNSAEYSNYMNFLAPDEEDAKLVSKYIRYRKSQMAGWYQRQMDQKSIDIDSGVNTVTFAKREHGWVYRRSTWQGQPFAPYYDNPVQYATLLELLNHVNTFVDTVNPDWVNFLERESDES